MPTPYNVFALTAAEIELDVLTGQYRLNRVDLYEDAGQSLSPAVDIGQCEGAFTMGMGLHLGEELKYNTETGQKLTDSAWVSCHRRTATRPLRTWSWSDWYSAL